MKKHKMYTAKGFDAHYLTISIICGKLGLSKLSKAIKKGQISDFLVEYEMFKSTELEPWNIYNAQRRSHNVQTDDEGNIET